MCCLPPPPSQNAHIMSDTEEAIYEDFAKTHPEVSIKLSQYKEELPWNRKKAYRETCLDRIDLNFEWHREALRVALDVLSPLHSALAADAEGDAEAGAAQPDPLLQELAALATTTSKSAFARMHSSALLASATKLRRLASTRTARVAASLTSGQGACV